MAYRIGDSITNPVTPMLAYFAIALTFAKKYDPKMGIGTFMDIVVTVFHCLCDYMDYFVRGLVFTWNTTRTRRGIVFED